MENKKRIRWLQLSDLHIFYSTKWNIMIKSYEELAKVFSPDFIVVTGDFRHIKRNKSYDQALTFLNKLSEIFSLEKTDFFFVPGNHDVSNFGMRTEIISTINSQIEENPDFYLKYIERLKKAFRNYNEFVKNFYGDSVNQDDERVKNPSDVYAVTWKNAINIVVLNTALISDGKPEKREIVDIYKLSQIETQLDKSKPTIVLAHHSPNTIVQSQRSELERLLAMMKVRAYLCGDEHKLGRTITNNFNIGEQTVGIVCGKSAIEQGDTYSDVCVIGYTWDGGKTNVQIFKWPTRNTDTPYQFIKSDIWYHHIDKPFSFKMIDDGNIPSTTITDRMEKVWNEFLTIFYEEDLMINSKLYEGQIRNRTGSLEPFKSEKIMRSLITIGIPFPAVADITKRTIDTILSFVSASPLALELNTKTVRLKVLESIRNLDVTRWPKEKINSWYIKYIRRYGHSNRTIKLCNIPERLNNGKTLHEANYKFIREILLPDLFQTICPLFNMDQISSSQKSNLSEEILTFINGCDVYIIDYNILKQMLQEIVTKPPHPWIIDETRRNEIIDYDRHSVESNLQEIAHCEKENREVPFAVLVELLHHTSAMMLDRYFSYCGCTDLESFNILIDCFRRLLDLKFKKEEYDLRFEGQEIEKLVGDFERINASVSDYYAKLCAISPQKVPITNSSSYIRAIKDFANTSLSLIRHFETD